MRRSLARLILRLFGWKVEGGIPADLKKYIVIAAPHTSWWDFPLGVLARAVIDRKIGYLGKKALFKPPFGFFFRWTGGHPVDRSKSSNTVKEVAATFKEREEFALALAPEGTRKKVDKLKTGFYHIAREAGIPIILASLDYGRKVVDFSRPFWPGDDEEADLGLIWDHFSKVRAKHPQSGIGEH